ncbi:hypothetical protein C2134_07285 [Chromobacterium sinusclupearum]|uniref:Uncharacterized protein n=1 Tax=Chromobacterium sinusclupearum TaxID=2077146 RepID=A0A2K4MQN6_9NEIS|nr:MULTISPECIES: hypothetical protein [Chromobacterium]POA99368.1 hypothetical protein C2134_07285 [Chromobacterium sinusclupearum]
MDRQQIPLLINYASNPNCLGVARLAAGGIVGHARRGDENLCAATLSLLLDMAQINVGVINDVLELTCELRRRGWDVIRTPDTAESGNDLLSSGDIGVLISTCHNHMYLVVNAGDQAEPEVADSQSLCPYPRRVMGGNAVPQTTFFLRAT